MSALDRYVVLIPGLAHEVHVYAGSREEALLEARETAGLRTIPAGSIAVRVNNDHYQERAA